MNRLVSHSPQDTADLAKQVWEEVKPLLGQKAVIIALEGELGSGKTTFTKALAHIMGIKDIVVSPTFTLHEAYYGLDHIDAWRTETSEEVMALGLERMVTDKRIIVIEWAEKVKNEIDKFRVQAKIIWIKFQYSPKFNSRRITVTKI